MKTILTYATLLASIARLQPAHVQDAPTLKERYPNQQPDLGERRRRDALRYRRGQLYSFDMARRQRLLHSAIRRFLSLTYKTQI